MLLSFILPSCMTVSNKDITNTNSFSFYLAMSYSIEVNNISEDINIDELRGKSK